MRHAVQLDVDADAQAMLDEIDNRLSKLSGLVTVRQLGDVHHVGLGVYNASPVGELVSTIRAFARAHGSLPLHVSGVAVFPGPQNVLWLAPVVTPVLLALHQRFHDGTPAAFAYCDDYYHPGSWVPHITLAMNVTPEALPHALAEAARGWRPFDLVLDQVRLITLDPVTSLAVAPLAGT